jgi:hypothetical protein
LTDPGTHGRHTSSAAVAQNPALHVHRPGPVSDLNDPGRHRSQVDRESSRNHPALHRHDPAPVVSVPEPVAHAVHVRAAPAPLSRNPTRQVHPCRGSAGLVVDPGKVSAHTGTRTAALADSTETVPSGSVTLATNSIVAVCPRAASRLSSENDVDVPVIASDRAPERVIIIGGGVGGADDVDDDDVDDVDDVDDDDVDVDDDVDDPAAVASRASTTTRRGESREASNGAPDAVRSDTRGCAAKAPVPPAWTADGADSRKSPAGASVQPSEGRSSDMSIVPAGQRHVV